MIASDRVDEGLVVVSDQGALVGLAELPVEPDPAGQGEQALGDPDIDAGQRPATVAFQPELAMMCPVAAPNSPSAATAAVAHAHSATARTIRAPNAKFATVKATIIAPPRQQTHTTPLDTPSLIARKTAGSVKASAAMIGQRYRAARSECVNDITPSNRTAHEKFPVNRNA